MNDDLILKINYTDPVYHKEKTKTIHIPKEKIKDIKKEHISILMVQLAKMYFNKIIQNNNQNYVPFRVRFIEAIKKSSSGFLVGYCPCCEGKIKFVNIGPILYRESRCNDEERLVLVGEDELSCFLDPIKGDFKKAVRFVNRLKC